LTTNSKKEAVEEEESGDAEKVKLEESEDEIMVDADAEDIAVEKESVKEKTRKSTVTSKKAGMFTPLLGCVLR